MAQSCGLHLGRSIGVEDRSEGLVWRQQFRHQVVEPGWFWEVKMNELQRHCQAKVT